MRRRRPFLIGDMVRPAITIETSAAGLAPGQVVTVETWHDPALVDLALLPAPPMGCWQAFRQGWREGAAARRPAVPVMPPALRRPASLWPWFAALWLLRP